MTHALALTATIIAIAFSALFSGTEIAFVQMSKVKARIDATSGGLINKILRRFRMNGDMFISSLLVGNNIVLVIYGITFSMILNPWLTDCFGDNDALVLICNTVISTLLILITGEFLPKVTFRINPNRTMRVLAIPMYLVYWILYPITILTSGISRGLMRLFGIKRQVYEKDTLTINEIDDYLQQTIENDAEGKEVENEVKIFRNAIDFKDTRIEECMIPRNEIVATDIKGTTRDDLIKLFTSTGLSKIVIYKDDIDNVQGYIHVSELFHLDSDWTKKIKPVIFTPVSMLANKMMRRMLAEKKSLTIVVDEFGGTAGLVTLEDLVEEIFGEIEDEHDRRRLVERKVGEGVYEISGRAEIESINDKFRLNLPESEEYNTLAGYILNNLEALPNVNDTFDIGKYRFTIMRMTSTRIQLVRIEEINDAKEEKD